MKFLYLFVTLSLVIYISSQFLEIDEEESDFYSDDQSKENRILASSNNSNSLNQKRQIILKMHNDERKKFNLTPMVLDDSLNNLSQSWSNHLANTHSFGHTNNHKYGENIADRTPIRDNSFILLMNQFLNEGAHWRYGNWDHNSKDGHDVSHYNQIIWAKSTKLGVGYSEDKKQNRAILVTNYLEPGNWKGQPPFSK